MVTTGDLLVLKKQLDPELCSIQRMAGAYVDANKAIVTRFNQKFLTLPGDQYEKYLKLIKEIYKGAGENVLTLDVKRDGVRASLPIEKMQELIEQRLEDEETLETVYKSIVDTYYTTDNYMILFLYAAYDVVKKAEDGAELDSEDVYEHIQCIIIPLKLEKEGLQYNRATNSITAKDRDWIVAKPVNAFVYPAFEEGCADNDHVMYFAKAADKKAPELITSLLGFEEKLAESQMRAYLKRDMEHTLRQQGNEEEYIRKFHVQLSEIVKQGRGNEKLTEDMLRGILEVIGIEDTEDIAGAHKLRYSKIGYPTVVQMYEEGYVAQQSAINKKMQGRALLERAEQVLGEGELKHDISKYLETNRG